MSAESRRVLVKRSQIIVGQKTEGPERGVEGSGGMALGQDEAIVFPQAAVMETEQRVEGGQIPSDMSDAAFVMHLKEPTLRAAYKLAEPICGQRCAEPQPRSTFLSQH